MVDEIQNNTETTTDTNEVIAGDSIFTSPHLENDGKMVKYNVPRIDSVRPLKDSLQRLVDDTVIFEMKATGVTEKSIQELLNNIQSGNEVTESKLQHQIPQQKIIAPSLFALHKV